MLCALYSSQGVVGILDTEDGVIEEYERKEAENLASQYGLRILGIENGDTPPVQISALSDVSQTNIEVLNALGHCFVFIPYKQRPYKSQFRLLIYDLNKQKYGGCIGLEDIDTEYLYGSLYFNELSKEQIVYASASYTDKHHYGEDREEYMIYEMEFSINSETGKLKIKRKTKGFVPNR